MTIAHDSARHARRREAASRSRERRERAHLSLTEARIAWWHTHPWRRR